MFAIDLAPHFPVEEILLAIRRRERHFAWGGLIISIHSKRLETFGKKGISCAACGRTGTHFRATSVSDPNGLHYHLGLYAGTVLMTRDHVIPKARGGADSIANSQPMCLPCNQRKADTDPRVPVEENWEDYAG